MSTVDVIQNEQIQAFGAINLEAIKNIHDFDSMKVCLARLSGFEQALREADRFAIYSVEFAKLEAAALIRAMELNSGNAKGLIKGDRGKAAYWLFKMSKAQRELTIQKCENGLSITQVYRMENKPEVGMAKVAQKIQAKKDSYLEEAESYGIVDISDFSECPDRGDRQLERIMWNDAKQGLRRTLLKNGFVGTGSGEQIYVNPKTANDEEIRKSIETRLISIRNDIENIKAIAHTANILIVNLPQLQEITDNIFNQFKKEDNK